MIPDLYILIHLCFWSVLLEISYKLYIMLYSITNWDTIIMCYANDKSIYSDRRRFIYHSRSLLLLPKLDWNHQILLLVLISPEVMNGQVLNFKFYACHFRKKKCILFFFFSNLKSWFKIQNEDLSFTLLVRIGLFKMKNQTFFLNNILWHN